MFGEGGYQFNGRTHDLNVIDSNGSVNFLNHDIDTQMFNFGLNLDVFPLGQNNPVINPSVSISGGGSVFFTSLETDFCFDGAAGTPGFQGILGRATVEDNRV